MTAEQASTVHLEPVHPRTGDEPWFNLSGTLLRAIYPYPFPASPPEAGPALASLAGNRAAPPPTAAITLSTIPANVRPQAARATHTNAAGIGSRNGRPKTRIRFWVQAVYMPSGKTAA